MRRCSNNRYRRSINKCREFDFWYDTKKTIAAYDLIQEKKYSQAEDVLNDVLLHAKITKDVFDKVRVLYQMVTRQCIQVCGGHLGITYVLLSM